MCVEAYLGLGVEVFCDSAEGGLSLCSLDHVDSGGLDGSCGGGERGRHVADELRLECSIAIQGNEAGQR